MENTKSYPKRIIFLARSDEDLAILNNPDGQTICLITNDFLNELLADYHKGEPVSFNGTAEDGMVLSIYEKDADAVVEKAGTLHP